MSIKITAGQYADTIQLYTYCAIPNSTVNTVSYVFERTKQRIFYEDLKALPSDLL